MTGLGIVLLNKECAQKKGWVQGIRKIPTLVRRKIDQTALQLMMLSLKLWGCLPRVGFVLHLFRILLEVTRFSNTLP